MIINAENLIVGRLASFVAKQALLGEKVDIFNCEKAVITGTKETVYGKFKRLDDRGTPQWGPFVHKHPDRFVRRVIRGMIDHKTNTGQVAFRRVMCYSGIPEAFVGKEIREVSVAQLREKAGLKYLTVKEVTDLLKRKD